MMLIKGVLFHQKWFKRKWIQISNYCTQTEAIEMLIRTEFRGWTTAETTKLLKRNPFLLEIPPKEMKRSFRALEKLRIEKRDIRIHPKLLRQTHFELINNYQRLLEVGFHEVTAYRLSNTREIMSQSVYFNQCFNFLPSNQNILQNIFSIAIGRTDSIYQMAYDRDMKLETVHRIALTKYFLDHIGYSSKEIDEIWQNYSILKNRSLQSIDKSRQLLETAYNMATRELPKFILTMQPEEIEELLRVGTVCGIDVRKFMILAPRCNLERLQRIQQICQSYNVPDYALKYSPKLFFLNYETLQSRLNEIAKLKRSNEFLRHVGIGRVILCMERLRIMLDSKRLEFNAVFNEDFLNFFLNGFIFPKSNPPIFYLCAVFNKSEDEIRKALQFHPHAKRYSFPIVYENIEYLLSQNFTYDDIFQHLPIILYSLDEIKEFFDRLKIPTETERFNVALDTLNKSQILRLCTYVIENKCNFNGEGVFLRSHAVEFDDGYSLQMEEIVKAIKP